jgi:hypothetical protein
MVDASKQQGGRTRRGAPERAGYIIRNSSEDPITDCFVQLVPMYLFGDPVSAWATYGAAHGLMWP